MSLVHVHTLQVLIHSRAARMLAARIYAPEQYTPTHAHARLHVCFARFLQSLLAQQTKQKRDCLYKLSIHTAISNQSSLTRSLLVTPY